jgi:beta-galactosidase
MLFLAGSFSVSLAQQRIRLDKHWQFLRQDLGGIWEAVRPVGKGNPESVPLWDSVSLPHCVNAWDAVDPDVNYYQGPAWYRTLLDLKNPYAKGNTLLHFEGAGQKTEVYIYTTKVGEHVGGYDEWTVDITQAVQEFRNDESLVKRFNGKVPLSVRTDNSRDLELIPSDLSDFNLYGGIYRYLNLVYVPAVSFDKVHVKASTDAAGKNGVVRVKAFLYDPANIKEGSTADVLLLAPDGKVVAKKTVAMKSLEDSVLFSVHKPQRWSDVSPQLYQVEIRLKFSGGETVHREKFGFRHFEFVKQGPFLLNGKRLLLRGTHRHEDHAGTGAAMTESQMRQEMLLMKDMGVNFIRLGHYQQSRIILDLCDSLGILVWEEIPWCRGGLGGDVYRAQARRMLTNMIQQHYNHPSIIIWGLGNENDWPGDFPEFDQQKIRAFMSELNTLSHALDNSRRTAIRRCDFCKDIVDVYSPSIWAGWYRGVYTDYKTVSEAEMKKVNHFLHVEWGGDSHAGRYSETPDRLLGEITSGKGADERAGDASLFGGSARVSKDGDWSESYICNLIDWHLKEQETMPWLSGTAYWPFKDFSTPVRPDNPVPYMNQKGVVERDFTPKESYYVFQSWWTSKLMTHIHGQNWPVRWGKQDELKMIKVYSNGEQAELWVNGKSQGIRKRNSQDFPAAGLRWMVKFQEGANDVRVVAMRGKTHVEERTTFTYETTPWQHPARIALSLKEEKSGIATIEAVVQDRNGVPCRDAAQFIRFGLAGDGELLDNLGTSSVSRYVQLYNGRAIIRVRTKAGESVLSARCETLPTTFISIKNK